MLMRGLEIPTLLPAGERHLQESELEKMSLFPETAEKKLILILELCLKQGRPVRPPASELEAVTQVAWSLGFSLIVYVGHVCLRSMLPWRLVSCL